MAPGPPIDRRRPACCGAVESFVHARHRDAHRRKVSDARSLINNGWSAREEERLQPSRRNAKHEQLQEDRFTNIERENMRLVLRMHEIDGRAPEHHPDLKTAAQIVLGMPAVPAPTQSSARTPRCSSLPAMGKGSNENGRMRELRRIDVENRRMLQRLQGAKATLSNNRLEQQHQVQQHVMRMRQESASRMPGSRPPLPFDAQKAPALDLRRDHVEDLHAEMLHRLQEMDKQEGHFENGASQAATPRSVCSPSSATIPSTSRQEGVSCVGRSEFMCGQMPNHSRLMVEQMMDEFQESFKPTSLPVDEVMPDDANDKNAVASLMAAAEALDSHALEATGYLSYEHVVERSRNYLAAARA